MNCLWRTIKMTTQNSNVLSMMKMHIKNWSTQPRHSQLWLAVQQKSEVFPTSRPYFVKELSLWIAYGWPSRWLHKTQMCYPWWRCTSKTVIKALDPPSFASAQSTLKKNRRDNKHEHKEVYFPMSPLNHNTSSVKEKLLKLNPIDYILNTEDPFVDWEPTVQQVSWIKYMYFTKDDQNMYWPNMDTDTGDNLSWHKRLIKITIQDQNQAHTESIE
jgi:hypothetical protein